MVIDTILWHRLDTPGHDACRLIKGAANWRIEGSAVFLQNGIPSQLIYHVDCDLQWHARKGQVKGWIGVDSFDFLIEHADTGEWKINNKTAPGLNDFPDLDFGFTPATNLIQLRRLALKTGEGADAPAVLLNIPDNTLELLDQHYERLGERIYSYAAPREGYSDLLEVTETGFIFNYPGLWHAEPVY